MMKKTIFAIVCGVGLSIAPGARATEYEDCLEKANGDMDIAMCNNAETARLMRRLQSRYNALASNKYFSSWNDRTLSAAQNFQTLFKQWVDYRDKYCSLYGYTFSGGQGTIGMVQTSQCQLDVTNRFAKDIEAVISVYNKMAVN